MENNQVFVYYLVQGITFGNVVFEKQPKEVNQDVEKRKVSMKNKD